MSGHLLSALRRRAFRAPLFLLASAWAATLIFLLLTPVHAQSGENVLLKNTKQGATQSVDVSVWAEYTQPFTTGPNDTGYELTSIEIRGNSNSSTVGMVVTLRRDSGGDPRAIIATFGNPSS